MDCLQAKLEWDRCQLAVKKLNIWNGVSGGLVVAGTAGRPGRRLQAVGDPTGPGLDMPVRWLRAVPLCLPAG